MDFIQHPSYFEQMHDIALILWKLTMENMNKLLKRLGLQCISFERLQTSGRINLIFNLKAHTKTSSYIEFILKVSNPHCYWKEHRIKNEVNTMQYLLEPTTIPLPKIFDYSVDFKTSILSCEYILMEKIHGNTLESIIEKVSDQILVKTAIEMTDYVKHREMFLGGSIEDGPTLGPFLTLKEYIIEHLRWVIRRIQTDEQLFEIGEHLILSL
ncbi:unnamed protein product [Rotaria sp. Silwood1]|nr:unnamed protein product [Rotaria sp. Silwood1]CAF1275693.1 unnamed protein product [Rotaria sp. Silwood1]